MDGVGKQWKVSNRSELKNKSQRWTYLFVEVVAVVFLLFGLVLFFLVLSLSILVWLPLLCQGHRQQT
jgi:hypothetical protein